jgi:hypothetical protein
LIKYGWCRYVFPAGKMKGTNEVMKVRVSPRMNRSVNGMGGKKEQETEIEQANGFQFLVCSALLLIVP